MRKKTDYNKLFGNLPLNEELATDRIIKEVQRNNDLNRKAVQNRLRNSSLINTRRGFWMRVDRPKPNSKRKPITKVIQPNQVKGKRVYILFGLTILTIKIY